MAIVTLSCPHCGFSKDLNLDSAPPNGTKVTCPKCRGSFTYMQPDAEVPVVFNYDAAPVSAVKNPVSSPVPPLPPPQTYRQTIPQLVQTTTPNNSKSIGAIIGILMAVVVLVYGISIGYTKLTAKRSADNWGMLKAIASSEQSERVDIRAQIESLLLASDYDGLERVADNYRTTKATFADGEWKLSVFYDEIAYYLRKRPEEDWVGRLDKLKEWVAAKPDSITARVALAECLDGYAFHGRGAAYANEVQEEQWRRFQERLQEAKDVLDQAKSLQNKCPGWWAAYLRLAVGLQWDRSQYDTFLASALAYEPTYSVFYYRAAWYFLPWWFGNDGDWENFAKSAADRIGGNNGDILYTRIIWFMARRATQDVVTQNPRIQWQRVNNGIKLIKSVKSPS